MPNYGQNQQDGAGNSHQSVYVHLDWYVHPLYGFRWVVFPHRQESAFTSSPNLGANASASAQTASPTAAT